ncbi:uncharacterized protein [Amphiura filiformis]|uniref:uncharacterized protein n=1 Tax=Amphiura filiformis TaxID=82378 RepID=UPI003B211261
MKDIRLVFVVLFIREVTCQFGWGFYGPPRGDPKCRSYQCDGGSKAACIDVAKVCDRTDNCPDGDDERDCQTRRCPSNCHCSVIIGSSLGLLHTRCMHGWSRANVYSISKTTEHMELSGGYHDKPGVLEADSFAIHNELDILELKNNSIESIRTNAFSNLGHLNLLDLSNNLITELQLGVFWGLRGLRNLIMRNVPITFAEYKTFDLFYRMDKVVVDNHFVCCGFKSDIECDSIKPVYRFFDCGRIMNTEPVRFGLAGFVCFLAFLFNFIVLACRGKHVIVGKKVENDVLRVQSLCAWNLGITGLMMAGYLFSVSFADVSYNETYCYRSVEWVNSVHCFLSGFLYFSSLEGTIMFLVFISIDQYIKMRYTLSGGKRIPMYIAVYISLAVWLLAFTFGAISALSLRSSTDFYDLSRFCIGLPIFYRPGGLEIRGNGANPLQLPFAIILDIFNLYCFIPIVYCYTYLRNELNKIYKVQKQQREEEERKIQEEEEEARKIQEAEDAEIEKAKGLGPEDDEWETGFTYGDALQAVGTRVDVVANIERIDEYATSGGITNGALRKRGSHLNETADVKVTKPNGTTLATNDAEEQATSKAREITLAREEHDSDPEEDMERRIGNYGTGEQSRIGNDDDGSEFQTNICNEYIEGSDEKKRDCDQTEISRDGMDDSIDGRQHGETDEHTSIADSVQDDYEDEETDEEKIIRMAGGIRWILIVNCVLYLPVLLVAALSQCRVPIPADVYWWLVVLILPTSAALNPIIYLYFTTDCKGRPPRDIPSDELAKTAYDRAIEMMNM